ncbi:hypothetical protein [Primorskyibacter sp. S187A]|uniref:hypothetical protein n=1 Tax=Primorskyibacter sp. S187A TaxID=3415130 RepID=UPI003C7DB5E1
MPEDSHTLERQADHHRKHAATALASLAERFAPARLGHDAMSKGTRVAEDLTQSALREVKRNPAGIALIGAGAAVILAGMARRTPQKDLQGSEDVRIAAADAKIKAKARIAAPTPDSASTMRKALDKGLDRLSPEARKRVAQARLKAVDAQDAVERHARHITAQAKSAHQARPFATALIAAGVGGLIGAVLPSTRTEGALLSAKRDQLLRNAEAALRAELADLEDRGHQAIDAGTQAARQHFDTSARR